MTGGIQVLIWGISFGGLLLCRCLFAFRYRSRRTQGANRNRGWKLQKTKGKWSAVGICQTIGGRESQADRAQVWSGKAGAMAVLADGIGKANTGEVCAQIAVDTILDQFEPYEELNNPFYFFKTAFSEAHRRIQKTIGERRGGACMGAVFLDGAYLHYAVAGNVKIALLRGEELIPVSKGQTLDVLAAQAYEDGKISKQDALWSMDEKRVWNYLGQDGFHEIEICVHPIRLKTGDKVLMMSKGIFEILSWREMEDILVSDMPVQELADRLILEAERKDTLEKDNGSVILIV